METELSSLVLLNPPGFIEWVAFAALSGAIVYSALKSWARLKLRSQKITLLALHFASGLLIAAIVLNPAVRVENFRELKPRLAVLIDNSWSMNLAPADRDGTRFEAVRDFIRRNEGFFAEADEKFTLDYYLFDDGLAPIAKDSLFTNPPNGANTDFRKILTRLAESEEKPDAAILFSDGADDSRFSQEDAGAIPNTGFPVYTVSATGGAARDAWIDGVEASAVSFLKYPTVIDVAVKSVGFNNESIPVTLKEDGNIVSVSEARLASNSTASKARFTLTPKSLGRAVYTVSIPNISGDSVPENNEKSFVVNVIADKIRALHVAGSPSWDVRFLRRALKRNPNVDLVSFFILREESDLVLASQNELSLIPFPVDDIFGRELDTFDIVIFQNFDFEPYGIYDYHLNNIMNYVVERGGAFLMIGDDRSFGRANYERTAISEILPVELYGGDSQPSAVLKLTDAGSRHPVMKIAPSDRENKELWAAMPNVGGVNSAGALKPDAVSLLETPEGKPALVLGRAGEGRAAAFLSASSWKWSFTRAGEGDASAYYDKFWSRLILWLVGDPEMRDVRISTDKTSYGVGERLKLTVSAFDGDAARSDAVKSALISPSGAETPLALEKISDGFGADADLDEFGVYTVRASVEGNTAAEDETRIVVEPPRNEQRGPTADDETLKKISETTGGRFIAMTENPSNLGIDFSPKRVVTGYKTAQIWDNAYIFLVLVAALSFEWALRRRWGLK